MTAAASVLWFIGMTRPISQKVPQVGAGRGVGITHTGQGQVSANLDHNASPETLTDLGASEREEGQRRDEPLNGVHHSLLMGELLLIFKSDVPISQVVSQNAPSLKSKAPTAILQHLLCRSRTSLKDL